MFKVQCQEVFNIFLQILERRPFILKLPYILEKRMFSNSKQFSPRKNPKKLLFNFTVKIIFFYFCLTISSVIFALSFWISVNVRIKPSASSDVFGAPSELTPNSGISKVF